MSRKGNRLNLNDLDEDMQEFGMKFNELNKKLDELNVVWRVYMVSTGEFDTKPIKKLIKQIENRLHGMLCDKIVIEQPYMRMQIFNIMNHLSDLKSNLP